MEWTITHHAEQQMQARRILREQVDELLAWPDSKLPDPKGVRDDIKLYVRGDVTAIVDEGKGAVVTVGINGATKKDWRTFDAPAGKVLAAREKAAPRTVVRTRAERKPRQPKAPVVTRNVLEGVHPHVAQAVLRELRRRNLDLRRIRVESPTEVTLLT